VITQSPQGFQWITYAIFKTVEVGLSERFGTSAKDRAFLTCEHLSKYCIHGLHGFSVEPCKHSFAVMLE